MCSGGCVGGRVSPEVGRPKVPLQSVETTRSGCAAPQHRRRDRPPGKRSRSTVPAESSGGSKLGGSNWPRRPALCCASIHDGTADASPKTKQPVHRSGLPCHRFQLQPVRHHLHHRHLRLVPHPMQSAVPPHLWTGPTPGEEQPASTAAALPSLAAKLERRQPRARDADGRQQPCGEQHLQWWPLPPWTPSLRLRES
jgi:hypothetical protein